MPGIVEDWAPSHTSCGVAVRTRTDSAVWALAEKKRLLFHTPELVPMVVDEVQKVPALLDEVHALIAAHGRRYRFALSGSSARKLRRLDANMLAGRVINR